MVCGVKLSNLTILFFAGGVFLASIIGRHHQLFVSAQCSICPDDKDLISFFDEKFDDNLTYVNSEGEEVNGTCFELSFDFLLGTAEDDCSFYEDPANNLYDDCCQDENITSVDVGCSLCPEGKEVVFFGGDVTYVNSEGEEFSGSCFQLGVNLGLGFLAEDGPVEPDCSYYEDPANNLYDVCCQDENNNNTLVDFGCSMCPPDTSPQLFGDDSRYTYTNSNGEETNGTCFDLSFAFQNPFNPIEPDCAFYELEENNLYDECCLSNNFTIPQQGNCSLCYDGSNVTDEFQDVMTMIGQTCGELQEFILFINSFGGETECDPFFHAIGNYYCGCPTLPPPTTDCSACPDGSLPDDPASVFIPKLGANCEEVNFFAPYYAESDAQCTFIQAYDTAVCCTNPPPIPCPITCPDGTIFHDYKEVLVDDGPFGTSEEDCLHLYETINIDGTLATCTDIEKENIASQCCVVPTDYECTICEDTEISPFGTVTVNGAEYACSTIPDVILDQDIQIGTDQCYSFQSALVDSFCCLNDDFFGFPDGPTSMPTEEEDSAPAIGPPSSSNTDEPSTIIMPTGPTNALPTSPVDNTPVTPTDAPVSPTEAPATPTEAPVVAPTDAPVAPPTETTEVSKGNTMTINGISTNMGPADIDVFQNQYKEYVEAYWVADNSELSDFTTSINITNQVVGVVSRRRSRHCRHHRQLLSHYLNQVKQQQHERMLQNSLEITFDQIMSYDKVDDDASDGLTVAEIVQVPFDNPEKQADFVTVLQSDTSTEFFDTVVGVSPVTTGVDAPDSNTTTPAPVTPTSMPPTKPDDTQAPVTSAPAPTTTTTTPGPTPDTSNGTPLFRNVAILVYITAALSVVYFC